MQDSELLPLTTPSCCVTACIACIGFAGNSVVLYVFARKKERQTANIFIISLAVSDLFACSLVMPMTIFMESGSYTSNALVCKLYYLVNSSGIPFSSMLMSAIAVERYFCICRPFLRVITVPRAKAIVLTLASVAFCMGLTAASFSAVIAPSNETDATIAPSNETDAWRWRYAQFGKCHELKDLHLLNFTISDTRMAFYYIFQKVHLSLFAVCIVAVFVLYVNIYRSVLRLRRKRRQRRRQQPQPSQPPPPPPPAADEKEEEEEAVEAKAEAEEEEEEEKQAPSATERPAAADLPLRRRRRSLRLPMESDALQNLKTAAMLFVVTIVFTATFMPAACMTLGWLNFNILVFYLYYLTHATNPLVYGFMNQNFRDDLRRLFCRR